MQASRLLGAAIGAAGFFSLLPVQAQNEAPFTIRRPPDGATVRESVRVEVPLASIPEGGYVSYSIDGQFIVALAPTAEQKARAKPGDRFVWVWDTKAPLKRAGLAKEVAPKDGTHQIAATLYVGSTAKETSSVKVTVANKIATDPGPVRLRYRYIDGAVRNYLRQGDTSIVTGLSQGMQGTGDQEMVAQKSKLLTSVEDKYSNGSAILRNKLTQLSVRQGGQETVYPKEQLPQSLYQQITPLGEVTYQNAPASFDQFAQLGVPVDMTLDLPKLPEHAVRIGDRWVSRNEKLDIPGTAPDQQPKVNLQSTFEGLEWEGGYPTAKIHQTFDSSKDPGFKEKSIIFGTVPVDSPSLKYERDIYLAYRSGTLVKVVRRIEVTGKTAQAINPGGAAAGMAGPPPGMGMPSMGGMMGAGGPYGGRMSGGPPGFSGGRLGGAAAGKDDTLGPQAGGTGSPYGSGGPTGYGGPPPGYGGPPTGYGAMMRGGRMGAGGPYGGRMGPQGMSAGPMGGPYGGPGMAGGPAGRFGGAPATGSPTGANQITLKSTTITELDRSGSQVASR